MIASRRAGPAANSGQKETTTLLEKIPPEISQVVLGIAGLLPTALLARFVWHQRLVRLGHRRFWSCDLLWEAPVAVFCAVLGGGVASYLSLDPMASHAVVGLVGWMGPRGIEVLLARLLRRYS